MASLYSFKKLMTTYIDKMNTFLTVPRENVYTYGDLVILYLVFLKPFHENWRENISY